MHLIVNTNFKQVGQRKSVSYSQYRSAILTSSAIANSLAISAESIRRRHLELRIMCAGGYFFAAVLFKIRPGQQLLARGHESTAVFSGHHIRCFLAQFLLYRCEKLFLPAADGRPSSSTRIHSVVYPQSRRQRSSSLRLLSFFGCPLHCLYYMRFIYLLSGDRNMRYGPSGRILSRGFIKNPLTFTMSSMSYL